MIIHCSKNLMEDLAKNYRGFAAVYENTEARRTTESLFVWHAKLYCFEHRKTVILVNDSNRFSVILYGLKAEDFRNFDRCARNGILSTLQRLLVNEDIIDAYLEDLGPVFFSKSENHQTVAWVNAASDKALFYMRGLNDGNMFGMQAASLAVSDYPVTVDPRNKNTAYRPLNVMAADLGGKYNFPLFQYKAVLLDVRLEMEDYEISRQLLVPVNISFQDLHIILQIAFDWHNYHLFTFNFDNGEFPHIRIAEEESELDSDALTALSKDVSAALDMEYGGDIRFYDQLAAQTLLSAYIENYDHFEYTYDFGDYWLHQIRVTEFVADCTEHCPKCISGIGNAPPEDCGGEGGYDRFVAAYYDPGHADHDDMVEWSKIVNYREFDLDETNRRLKNILRYSWI